MPTPSPFDILSDGTLSRRTFLAGAGATALAGVSHNLWAQAKTPPKKEILEKTLTTDDGRQLAATYYKSLKGKDAPVLILLHQQGSSRLVWKTPMVDRLHEDGYAVLTFDFRKHGEAGGGEKLGAADYIGMVNDLETAKAFLVEEHEKGNLNIRKTGIVAPAMAAPIALVFAAADWLRAPHDDAPTFEASTPRGQDVRALVLLSPNENLPGLGPQPSQAAITLKNPSFHVATLIGVGTKDKVDKGKIAREIHKKIAGKDGDTDINLFSKYETNARGTEMLERKLGLKVEDHMLGFFKKFVYDLKDEWRSRKSRLRS
jgi:hypothetical protein